MNIKKFTAWGVHAYTMTGGVLGFAALLCAVNGDVRDAFFLLMSAYFIDCTDGMLARKIKVWEIIPGFSGAQLDDMIDVLTYAYVPLFIIASQKLLPHPAWLVFPLVAVLYAYGQVNMKTADKYFLGFPSYWNIIALYLYWLQPPPVMAVLIVLVPSVLSFVPTRYLYPSKSSMLWRTSWVLGGIWFCMLVYMLVAEPPPRVMVLLSLYYPAYYMVASFYVDWRHRKEERTTNEHQ